MEEDAAMLCGKSREDEETGAIGLEEEAMAMFVRRGIFDGG
jgi:hypothetical protein